MSLTDHKAPAVWQVISSVRARLPGLALAAGLAAIAYGIRHLSGFAALSPLVIVTLIGMGLSNLTNVSAVTRPGILFSSKTLLRAGIVLMGLQLTLRDVIEVGPEAVAIVVFVSLSTLGLTMLVSPLFKVQNGLAALIAVGTAICGASAIAATRNVCDADEDDTAYALICVTVLGTVSMIAYPGLSIALGLSPNDAAIWAGASIHEVAQVVGAAYQLGEEPGQLGTIVKLSRVLMLVPAILLISFFVRARGPGGQGKRPPLVPGFLTLFILVVLGNSLLPIPQVVHSLGGWISGFLMAMALAGLGLNAKFVSLKLKGFGPLMLAITSTIYIAAATAALLLI